MDRPPLELAGPRRETVLRTFVGPDGRITMLPRRLAKRLVVLDHAAAGFEVGVDYTEAQVNDILRRLYDDHVTLRRYLVDEGFLSREAGRYWRTGGTVEV